MIGIMHRTGATPVLPSHVRDWVRWDAIQVNEVSVVTLRMLLAYV